MANSFREEKLNIALQELSEIPKWLDEIIIKIKKITPDQKIKDENIAEIEKLIYSITYVGWNLIKAQYHEIHRTTLGIEDQFAKDDPIRCFLYGQVSDACRRGAIEQIEKGASKK